MLKTTFTYNQLLEWDKYDLAEHILDLQDELNKNKNKEIGKFYHKNKQCGDILSVISEESVYSTNPGSFPNTSMKKNSIGNEGRSSNLSR